MKKVLLPIDGSKRSLRTMEAVKHMFSVEGTEIIIVKVVSSKLHNRSLDEIMHNVKKVRPELETMAAMLPDYQVQSQVLVGGTIGAEIIEYAKKIEADAIVMTRSSRGPVRKLGSVATYIVRNASFLDVFVMREEDD